MRPSRATLISLLLLGLPAVSLAADIHVPGDYPTIQEAIDAAEDWDTVLVAPGTYIENLNIYGKYNFSLRSTGGPEVTILDGSNPADPTRGSTVLVSQTHDSTIEGFTITGGTGTDYFYMPYATRGGGGIMCISSTDLIIRGNIIVQNTAWDGGGIVVLFSEPIIEENLIHGNLADGGGPGARGGGGGIALAFLEEGYPPLYPVIHSNVIYENTADGGGGVFLQCRQGLGVTTLTNNLILRNSAAEGEDGGGIYFSYNSEGEMVNNTICFNVSGQGGGIATDVNATVQMANTIIYGNTATTDPQIHGPLEAIFCNVEGGWPGEGNIDADPLFADAANDDCHLLPGSPCIDTGTNAAPGLPPYDYEGDDRILDGDDDGTATVDMGADEHVYVPTGLPPSIDSLALTSELGTDYTNEDLTASASSTDPEGDPVTHIHNWKIDGQEIAVLLMPFDTSSESIARDYTSGADHGTVAGASWNPAGQTGGCLDFVAAEDDYVVIDPAIELADDLTLMAWVNQATASGRRILAAREQCTTSYRGWDQYALSITTDGKIHFSVNKTNDCGSGSEGDRYRAEDSAIPVGEFVHLAVTVEANSTEGRVVRLYVNGTEYPATQYLDFDTSSAFDPARVYKTYIGAKSDRPGEIDSFDGAIDDVRVFDRALSPRQIARIYRDTQGGLTNDAGIADQETLVGEVWNVEVTPNDGTADGIAVESGPLTIFEPPDEIGCRLGRVDLGRRPYEGIVLTINESEGDAERKVRLATDDALEITMDAPPAGPATAPFVLYVWLGEPTSGTVTPHPKQLGNMCYPTPLTGGTPRPKKIWNNIGRFSQLGEPNFPSTPAPSTVFAKANGLGFAVMATFQGIIFDNGSAATKPASITNAVTLVVE